MLLLKTLSTVLLLLSLLFPETSKQFYMHAEEVIRYSTIGFSSTSSRILVKEPTFIEVGGCSPGNLRRTNSFTVIFVEFC